MPPSSTPHNTPITAVNNASNKIIIKALKKLKKHQFHKHRLLGPKNYYKLDTITKTDDPSLTINTNHLSEYIAASTFTHCFDGWNFLSRGIESLINGDVPSCIHFVYYSELRAVMSLMACEGIGIFNNRHVYFDINEAPNTFRNGTHVTAQKLIDEWSKLELKKQTIFKHIKISNTNLEELINSTGTNTSSAYVSTIVNDWFIRWSLDLKLADDKRLRNEMSYRPRFDYATVDSKRVIDSVFKIWSGLEPTPSIRFLELDRHLVRLAFERLFELTSGQKATSPSYKIFVENAISDIGESANINLLNFLIRETDKEDHFILKEAQKARINNNIIIIDPIPMICRAILLLRMACGSVNSTFDSCYISSSDLNFWWENLAYKFGITNSIDPEIDTSDLFIDIKESIDSIKDEINILTCTKDSLNIFSSDINTVKQFQRTCFWGIGI